MQKILEQLAITAELMGTQISPSALAMMASDLNEYNPELIIEALGHLRKESKGRFSLGAIVEKIEELTPGGRPSPDEAWAMIPRDEYTSAVMTQEMAESLHIAQPLLDEGDQVAARMAFKEAYVRIVDQNKRNGIKPSWFPSLGSDKEGRESVIAEAVRLGRIEAQHAISLLPPENAYPMLQCAGEDKLALEYKPPSKDEIKSKLAELKAALKIKTV